MKRYILLNVIIIFSLCIFMVFTEDSFAATNGGGYCQVPPYVIQNIAPNIMIVLDNSGSMFYFSYFDGFSTVTATDDNLCTNTINPCSGFIFDSDKDSDIDMNDEYPYHKYYGYFDPDYWYTYSSNRFIPVAPKTGSGLSGERAKNSTEWDGNFLNWLTMRRIDIVRKVLTGGKQIGGEGTGFDRLSGEKADCNNRGRFKRVTDADRYTPYNGTRKFYVNTAGLSCDGSGSGTSSFSIRNSSAGDDGTGEEGTWNVSVRVPVPVEGVVQQVVGTKARLGLTFYKVNSPTPHGGEVKVRIGGMTLPSFVNEINITRPKTNTPLAETLWTLVGYFAQEETIITGGPGPLYATSDYKLNSLNDPFNYGTSGQPRYPTCARSYILYITDGEPCGDGNLPSTLLNYANGKSKFNCGSPGDIDKCPAVSGTAPETFSFPASTFPSCYGGYDPSTLPGSGYVAGIEDVSLYAHTTDLRSSTIGETEINGIQNLTIFPVFAFGKGSTLLRYTAINGGFEDINGNNIPDLQSEWDSNGDGEPDNFYEATDGYELEQAITNAFSTMLERASSGTAASVLASGEGSGANLLQAVFYPRRRFGNDIISWTGALQNLWYYVDPFFALSSIREDTAKEIPNSILHLINDYIVDLAYDTTAQETRAFRCQDTDGDGECETTQSTLLFENLGNLWEAGIGLWSRDLSTDARTIYTQINGTLIPFSTANASTLKPYFDLPTIGDTNLDGFIDGDINHDASVNDTDAEYLIRYVHGEDGVVVDLNSDGLPEYRSRTVTIGSDTHSWKLGDILNSTPKISSWLPLNAYYKYNLYKDNTYGPVCEGCSVGSSTPADASHFVTMDTQDNIVDGTTIDTGIDGYQRRGMVFVGGNDGMLHAFKLGSLELLWTGQTIREKARLTGTDLGKEMWAFIPKNVLPYLKYMMDPEYCHVYSVDMTPIIVDVSINNDTTAASPASCSGTNYWNCTKTANSWRTILIGGMRLGGACRQTASACTDCVKAPGADLNSDGDKTDAGENLIGLSSYFALDVTDQNKPKLLWEFSHEDLGFASTGASIVKIGARQASGAVDVTKNGRWFVVFGSGPTGPISVGDMQFLGRSDQELKLFIFDLNEGPTKVIENDNVTVKPTGILNAFASSMFDSARDFIQTSTDYQDDAVYIGYTNKCASTNDICTKDTWTDGGVIRLVTKKNALNDTPLNPANWAVSKVIQGTGTVTSGVKSLQETDSCSTTPCSLYLSFGTGRYFYVQGSDVDDPDKNRALFGMKEPCYLSNGTFDSSCSTTITFCTTPSSSSSCGGLTNVTNIANVVSRAQARNAAYRGWYINLDGAGNFTYPEGSPLANVTRGYKTERLITDPTTSTCGGAFFVTYKPYSDECALGGKSFLWGVDYATGGLLPADCQFIALVQLSTGSIEHIMLGASRKSTAFEGVPPIGQGLTVFAPATPIKRILHLRER